MDEKEDLRIIRTKKHLVNALILLLEKNSFDKISVIDICDKAMVHRTTFYKHFEDKFHLLSYLIDEIKEQLYQSAIENENYSSPKELYMNIANSVLDYIVKYRRKLVLMINNNLNEIVYNIFFDSFNKTKKFALSKSPELSGNKLPLPITANFFTGGFTSLAIWWLTTENGCTKEELLHYVDLIIDEKYFN